MQLTGQNYGVNSDEVPLTDIRDCAYMLDREGVMTIWAKSLLRAGGLQYIRYRQPIKSIILTLVHEKS